MVSEIGFYANHWLRGRHDAAAESLTEGGGVVRGDCPGGRVAEESQQHSGRAAAD